MRDRLGGIGWEQEPPYFEIQGSVYSYCIGVCIKEYASRSMHQGVCIKEYAIEEYVTEIGVGDSCSQPIPVYIDESIAGYAVREIGWKQEPS